MSHTFCFVITIVHEEFQEPQVNSRQNKGPQRSSNINYQKYLPTWSFQVTSNSKFLRSLLSYYVNYLYLFEPPAIICKEGIHKYIFLQTFIKAQLCNNPLQYFCN